MDAAYLASGKSHYQEYPEYWEYWKMVMCVHYNHEWRSAGWVDKVSKTYEDEVEAMVEYTSWRGL